MKTTPYTEMILDSKVEKIYEDDMVVAFLDPKPVKPGHTLIVPREAHPIIELTPDEVLEKMLAVANKISIAMFEEMKCHGTNILIQNGIPAGQTIPHLSINVIPRDENDGLNFNWEPKKLTEEEISAVEMKMREELEQREEPEQEPDSLPPATTVPSNGEMMPPLEQPPQEPEKDLRIDKLERIPRW